MRIIFKRPILEKCYKEHKEAKKRWNDPAGRNYIRRVNILKAVHNISELASFPQLKYHPLKGDRKGQHAINVTNKMRLIFTIQGEHQDVVCIEEVIDYHGS